MYDSRPSGPTSLGAKISIWRVATKSTRTKKHPQERTPSTHNVSLVGLLPRSSRHRDAPRGKEATTASPTQRVAPIDIHHSNEATRAQPRRVGDTPRRPPGA